MNEYKYVFNTRKTKKSNLTHLGRYRVTVITEPLSEILWNIRPIESRYSCEGSCGGRIRSTLDWYEDCSCPPQHGACCGFMMDLSGSTINWKPWQKKNQPVLPQAKIEIKSTAQPVRAVATPTPGTPRPSRVASCRWPGSGQIQRSRRPAAACSPRRRNRCAGTACPGSSRSWSAGTPEWSTISSPPLGARTHGWKKTVLASLSFEAQFVS